MRASIDADASRVNPEGGATSARDLLRAAIEMSTDEMVRLRDGLSARLSMSGAGGGVRGECSPPVDWLLVGIEEELRRRGAHGPPLRKMRAYRGYEERSRPGWDALVTALGPCPDGADVVALGRLAAGCLAEHVAAMDGGRRPVNGRSMLSCAGEVASAVDAAFPGYAASGMLRMALSKG